MCFSAEPALSKYPYHELSTAFVGEGALVLVIGPTVTVPLGLEKVSVAVRKLVPLEAGRMKCQPS